MNTPFTMTDQSDLSPLSNEKTSEVFATKEDAISPIVQEGSSEEVAPPEHSNDFEDLDLDGLDPIYRAKVHCLNQAMQDIGMGRYQWLLFCLTGFGWMADNASIS
jgi:hypothetical protein